MKYLELAKYMLDADKIYGVRSLCDDENYSIGDICRESYDWDIENDCSTYFTTGKTANGTCATYIDIASFKTDDYETELAERIEKIISENRGYCGQQVIIEGNRVNNDGMFDEGEVRIIDAKVIAIVD